jgi:hypothetical protein
MARRSKADRERDRDELVGVLEDADKPLRTDTLICRAYGEDEAGTAWWKHYSTAYADLRALERAGRVTRVVGDGSAYHTVWALPSPDVVGFNDVVDDLRDLWQLEQAWEDAGDVD